MNRHKAKIAHLVNHEFASKRKIRPVDQNGEMLADQYRTPDSIFDPLDAEFDFTVDAAASYENRKCSKYYSRESDGLKCLWVGERVWCNPPYSNANEWVEKAYNSQTLSCLSVLLINPSPGSKYWHEFIFDGYDEYGGMKYKPGVSVRFFKGRIKFLPPPGINDSGSPRYDNCIVIFRPITKR